MYSYEQRKKAVELYIKYGLNAATVIQKIGYPDRHSLKSWYEEYCEKGHLHRKFANGRTHVSSPYSEEQMRAAVSHYVKTGKRISSTIKALGYPKSPKTLSGWIEVYRPREKRVCRSGKAFVEYPKEVKEAAVFDFISGDSRPDEVAERHGVNRSTLYFWKNQLLGEDYEVSKNQYTQEDVDSLKREADELRKEVRRLRLEKDVLEKAAEVLKKGKGISLDTLTNREKALVIDALRGRHSLKNLLAVLDMAKSSYCYQSLAIKRDKYSETRLKIKEIFNESHKSYGYRRIHLEFKNKGMTLSEKVIIRLMKELGLKVSMKMIRKYNSYKGEITPAVANLVERDFHAENPNELWLTDITEFHIPAGKVYLSPIIDCYDGMAVAWTIGTSPSSELANSMLRTAIGTLNGERPIVHSDRGFHYRTNSWISIMDEAGLTRSMSRKACSPDNAACEGFFGRLKNEMFYNRRWIGVSIDEFVRILDDYIHWYNEKRIKLSLGGLSPLDYRRKMGLTA